MSASAYPTTEETTNANRRNRLLLGPCTDQLRDVLRHEVPPITFSSVFKQKEKNIPNLNAEQKKLLYPVSGSYTGNYEDMDISLLYILLRNVTNIPPHKKNWGNDPETSDRTLSANIERIRIERNSCVHSPDTSIPNINFNDFWSKIENVVAEIDCYLANGGKYKKEVDYLRRVEMDPTLDKEIRQAIKRQAEEDKDIKEHLQQLEDSLSRKIQKSCIDIPERKKVDTRLVITGSKMKEWKQEDNSFVKPHALPDIMKKIEKQPIVVFLGGPRCGKKILMHHIALQHLENGFQVVELENIDELETFFSKDIQQLFILENATGVWCLDDRIAKEIHYKEKKIQACLAVRNSKLFFTCQRTAYNESINLMKYFFFDEKHVIDIESKALTLNLQDRKSIFEKYCKMNNLTYSSEMINDRFQFEAVSMFPFLCKLFCSCEKIRDFGTDFLISYIETMEKIFDVIKTESKIHYAALVSLALRDRAFSEESFEESIFSEILTNVCKTCNVSTPPNAWCFMESLASYSKMLLKKSEENYQFIDISMQDILLCHYGRKFITIIIKYASCKFLSKYITIQESDVDAKKMRILLYKSKFQALSERFLKDIMDNNLYDVFNSAVLQSNVFVDSFINILKMKNYEEIKWLFLRCHDVREMTPDWLYPDFKTISWAIAFGHRRIVEFVLSSAYENGDSYENVLGENKVENIRMVKLACFNGDVDMYNSIIRFYPRLEYFQDKTSSEKKEQYNEIIDSKMLPKLKEKSLYASGFTLMTAACFCRCLPLVKEILTDIYDRRYLFDPGQNVNRTNTLSLNSIYGDDRTPLEAAILSRDTSFVKELIEIGADLNFRSPLYYAMELNALEIENVLLENGAEISEVLEKGSLEGNKNVVFKLINGRYKEILEERGIFQSSLTLALYKACQGEHFSIIEMLIEHGARINASLEDGLTPLHIAIGRSNVFLAQYLINKGSDCNCTEYLLRTPLHIASQKHLLPIVNLLLEKGTNCNECDIKKCTPLHLAIDPHDDSDNKIVEETEDLLLLIQTLIDNNTNIDMCDENQTSPLLSACKNRMWLVAERLIANGANVNMSITYEDSVLYLSFNHRSQSIENLRESPLHLASGSGVLPIVEKLITKGANVNICNSSGKSPIYVASENGFLDVVEKLIENGSSCNGHENTPLEVALQNGHMDIALKLILNGADISYGSLLLASEHGFLSVVDKLIEKGTNVNESDNSGIRPIHAASKNGFFEVVETLIEHGSSCNELDQFGNSPLIYALRNGYENIALQLISHGANIYTSKQNYISSITIAFQRGLWNVFEKLTTFEVEKSIYQESLQTALIYGMENKHTEKPYDRVQKSLPELVEKLINKGFIVNNYDAYGNLPLHYAVNFECQEVVEKLLSHGASCNQCNKDGISPLIVAINTENQELIIYLIRQGSNIRLCDKHENSPLLCASENGLKNVVDKLIESGAEINKSNVSGDTPLSCASKNGYWKVAESLMRNGADISLLNTEGESAFFQACENGHIEVMEALIRNGAKVNTGIPPTRKTNLLHNALNKGNLLIAEKLIDYGADCNVCDKEGKTPAVIASQEGYFHIFKKIIDRDVNFKKSNDYVLKLLSAATANGHLAIVHFIISHSFNFTNYEPQIGDLLLKTIEFGYVFVACKLIELLSDVNHRNKHGVTALHMASGGNYLCIVEKLVQRGADCNSLNNRATSPLSLAAENGCISITNLLLENKADSKIADLRGYTPLHLASLNGHALIVKSLLKHGADCNARNEDGLTPLLLALDGHSSVVELLIQHGANVNDCYTDGKSLLHSAVESGFLSVVDKLIQLGADVKKCDKTGWSTLHALMRKSYFENQKGFLIFKKLLANGADYNKCTIYGESPLVTATKYERTSYMRMLIDLGADITIRDKDGKSLLFLAVDSGNNDSIKMFIDLGADVNLCDKKGKSPLLVAVKRQNISSIKILIDHGADINMCNKDGRSPLSIVAEKQNIFGIKMLIDHGADINLCDKDGKSPLFIAAKECERQNISGMKILIDHGADINMCDKDGRSPLFIVTERQNIFSIKMLIDHGADINMCNKDGKSPLFIASSATPNIRVKQKLIEHCKNCNKCDINDNTSLINEIRNSYSGYYSENIFKDDTDVSICKNYGDCPEYLAIEREELSCIKILLDHGADVNQCDIHGRSPLHIAAEKNKIPFLKTFLNKGADVNIFDKYGHSPLDVAVEKNNKLVVKMLIDQVLK